MRSKVSGARGVPHPGAVPNVPFEGWGPSELGCQLTGQHQMACGLHVMVNGSDVEDGQLVFVLHFFPVSTLHLQAPCREGPGQATQPQKVFWKKVIRGVASSNS
jgi:hypothetical protein